MPKKPREDAPFLPPTKIIKKDTRAARERPAKRTAGKKTYRILIAERRCDHHYENIDNFKYDHESINDDCTIILEDWRAVLEYMQKVMPILGESGLVHRITITA